MIGTRTKTRGNPADRRRARLRNSTPAAYLKTMLEIATERGVSPEQVLNGTRITPALLDTPDLRISTSEAAHAMFNAVQLTGDRGFGLEFGLRTTPTAHGYVGFAAMSCSTLREALELVIRYLHLRQGYFSLHLGITERECILEQRDKYNLGAFRQLVHECLILGLFRMIGFLTGLENIDGELWFDWPEPDYFARYRARMPKVRFGMPSVQLRIPKSLLDHRLVMADASAVRKAVEHCEREMAMTSPEPENLLERVRAELTPGTDGYPDLESIASCLFMSGRTLKRKLEERGTSFQKLLDEVRHRQALRLLQNPDLDIQQIATALGYKDPPSFTRAFRRWSGKVPSEMRNR